MVRSCDYASGRDGGDGRGGGKYLMPFRYLGDYPSYNYRSWGASVRVVKIAHVNIAWQYRVVVSQSNIIILMSPCHIVPATEGFISQQ